MTNPHHDYYSGPQFSAPESKDPPTPAQLANLGQAAANLARQITAFVSNLDMPRDPALPIDHPLSAQFTADTEDEIVRNLIGASNSLYMIAGVSLGLGGTIGHTAPAAPAVAAGAAAATR